MFGHTLFLLPFCAIMLYENWPYFWDAFQSGEQSSNAGGLLRWPARALMVAGFALLFAQDLSELVKRIAELRQADPEPPEPAPSSGARSPVRSGAERHSDPSRSSPCSPPPWARSPVRCSSPKGRSPTSFAKRWRR